MTVAAIQKSRSAAQPVVTSSHGTSGTVVRASVTPALAASAPLHNSQAKRPITVTSDVSAIVRSPTHDITMHTDVRAVRTAVRGLDSRRVGRVRPHWGGRLACRLSIARGAPQAYTHLQRGLCALHHKLSGGEDEVFRECCPVPHLILCVRSVTRRVSDSRCSRAYASGYNLRHGRTYLFRSA